MATGFSTRSGPDGYRLNFDTDNLDYYLLMQKIARYCVDGKPAADVAEVRHGRWEKFSTASGIISRVRCSVFSGTQPLTFESMLYCPKCGARMDKGDEIYG